MVPIRRVLELRFVQRAIVRLIRLKWAAMDVAIASIFIWHRFVHSVKTLAVFMAIWTVLVGTVFWMEPVLIWQIIAHGHFGLGHVTFEVYRTAAWAFTAPSVS